MPRKTIDVALTMILLLISGILVAGSLVGMWSDAQREQWPSTTGRVLASGNAYCRGSPPLPCTWFADFEYTVAGKKYRRGDDGGKMGLPLFAFPFAAREYAHNHYPIGKEVTVYYNPFDPSEAVLNQGIERIWLVFIPLIIFFLLLAIFSYFESARHAITKYARLIMQSLYDTFGINSRLP